MYLFILFSYFYFSFGHFSTITFVLGLVDKAAFVIFIRMFNLFYFNY